MGDGRYAAALAALHANTDKARAVVLDSIDPAWWQAQKDRPWSETYPIIYEKTCLVPVRMAMPAYYAAQRYALGGDRADFEAARRILMHLAAYTFEFEHYDVGMNYAIWGCRVLAAYDILFEGFTAAERAALDGFFTRLARAVLRNDVYWIENGIGGGINNHLAWHKMMLGLLGLFYDRPWLVEFALDGPRGIIPLLDDGLVDDGLWCEASLTYHFTAIVPMMMLADAMRNAGCERDLYTLTTAHGRSLRQPYDAMFGVLFPDRTIPPIGDAYGRRVRLENEFSYVYAARAWKDGRYAWLLSRAEGERPELLMLGLPDEEAVVPEVRSRICREHGYAFLRTRGDSAYWDSDAACAFLTFDKSGVHANQDKLSLMLFANGVLLLPDVEAVATVPHAFSAAVQQQLNRSALSQNTVMIDGRDQRGIGELLTLVEFRDEPDCRTVTAADTKGLLYEGVRQSRTVVLTDDYCLDVFQVVADRPRDIHWIVHTMGRSDDHRSCLALQAVDNPMPPPAQWLRDFGQARTDEDFTFQWTCDGVALKMTMTAVPGTTVLSCGYPTTDEPNAATIPMLLVHRYAQQTVFAALYQSSRTDIPTIYMEGPASATDGLEIRLKVDDRVAHHRIPALRY